MYNTRLAAQRALSQGGVENKPARDARMGHNVAGTGRSTATGRNASTKNQNEVGGLVGALSKGCNVKTEQSSETSTRAFGTNLSNSHINGAIETTKGFHVAESTKGGLSLALKGGSKATAQQKDSSLHSVSEHTNSSLPSTATSRSSTSCSAAATSHQSQAPAAGAGGAARAKKPRATRAAAAAAKAAEAAAAAAAAAMAARGTTREQQSMTATLTARAEEASRLVSSGSSVSIMDADMEDVEDDIDADDKGDIMAVTEYVKDIYAWYRKSEHQSIVPADYMAQTQKDINDHMRTILVDWLIEVHLKFTLLPETLFLTTNLIDRFLAVHGVNRKHLQLVGVTAMLLAAKYEEIYAPEVKDFVYISDNAYTKDQVLGMEKLMLNTLKFHLSVPTPYMFATRFFKAAQADKELQTMTWFFIELCLPSYKMLQFSPSHLAAAALFTAHKTLFRSPCWTMCLQRHSGFSEQHLLPCADLMIELHLKAGTGNLTAVHTKYMLPKFSSVAGKKPAAPLLPRPSN
eukprot:TRINITY_DN9665_c1_g2_i1.p1 TRINITY_DN9665_c1_g2~~TRINITY_DN9665_c1_g2_i1.p1  ORF type:complete len:518 (-),score=130.10 TRINITY_DN9665_c1_g2_i1:308-1861(-)